MTTIANSKFIFSNERKFRIRRHLLFWFAWFLYYGALHAANPFGHSEISYFRNPVFTFSEAFLQLLPQPLLTYGMLYIILPTFIMRKRYVLSVLGTLVFWFIGGYINLYWVVEVIPRALAYSLPEKYLFKSPRPESVSIFMAIMVTYKGAFTITAFALLFKMGKNWYQNSQRNMQLQKENSDAQLRLLMAQVHPHFLFNTLNNIFSQTQMESPKGSAMILELSDILRYVLYEGQKTIVPLSQELGMINKYIDLEKIRYGNKLDLHIMTVGNPEDLYIAPLLLLPFIENCFKHGASNMLANPWVNLTVEIKHETVVMKLMNGKALVKNSETEKHGIGISNVQQRLDLLYKNKYDLRIRDEEEVFVVDLSLQIERKEGEQEASTHQPNSFE